MEPMVQKIRQDGNSWVVTIPRDEAAKVHMKEGMPVNVRADEETGELRIQALVLRPRPNFTELMEGVAAEDRALLDRLADFDKDKGT